jgi:NTP pyrophosphatase (non-canonical NTP hydrolase)
VTFSEVRDRMADELADTAIYLDLLAQCAGIDLGDAVERKWNSRSRELGIGIRIGMSGRWVDK